MVRGAMVMALAAGLLAACQMQAPLVGDGEKVLPLAPVMEFNFEHKGATYPIRLQAAMDGVAGDVVVFGYDPASEFGREARLAEVAEAACTAEGRSFDQGATRRGAASGQSMTFIGACL